MKYYLETNSLRSLNKELNLLSNDCFTSSLSIFELISDITKSEKEFNIRKSVIKNVLKSDITVNWDSQKTIKVKAFPGMTFKDYEIVGLKELTFSLIKCNTLQEFQILTKEKKYNQNFFKKLDELYSKHLIDSTLIRNKKFKKHIENDDSLKSKEFLKKLKNNITLNKRISLSNIVNDIVDAMEKQLKTTIDRTRIYDSYNGSIDVFIEYFSYYTAFKNAELKIPAKNDFLDLLHLIYLGNGENIKIVTNDKLLEKLNVTISIEDFKNLYKFNNA